jgi:hypothetical protein
LGLYKKAKRITRSISKRYYSIRLSNKPKIFCIGLNKTGTTSLGKAMKDFGFIPGNQSEAELLFNDWVKRDFKKIINYCKTAEFFQDVPFSYPYTFAILDQAFPKSKFILTVRDNPEQWYNSLINYHGKLFGNGNIPPTAEDLKQANYVYKGFPYDSMKKLLNVPDEDLYNKDILIESYKMHNKIIIDYFNFRKEDLLVLNVAEEGSYEKLCHFLNRKCELKDFPWENKT